MKFLVEMHAFGNGQLREVEVPDHEVRADRDYVLGPIFHFGQNDFQPQNLPSVSVGDIIQIPGDGEDIRRFVVMPSGFQEVTADFMPPEGDCGGMYAYRLSLILKDPS